MQRSRPLTNILLALLVCAASWIPTSLSAQDQPPPPAPLRIYFLDVGQ